MYPFLKNLKNWFLTLKNSIVPTFRNVYPFLKIQLSQAMGLIAIWLGIGMVGPMLVPTIIWQRHRNMKFLPCYNILEDFPNEVFDEKNPL